MTAAGTPGDDEANLAIVQRGFDLFNEGDLDALIGTVFHPEVDYSGDPDASVLTGEPVEVQGAEAVRRVWLSLFGMFGEIKMTEIELEPGEDGVVLGSCHMVTRGESSSAPIDAHFYFAWVIRERRWRFMAAKLNRDQATAALDAWLRAQAA